MLCCLFCSVLAIDCHCLRARLLRGFHHLQCACQNCNLCSQWTKYSTDLSLSLIATTALDGEKVPQCHGLNFR